MFEMKVYFSIRRFIICFICLFKFWRVFRFIPSVYQIAWLGTKKSIFFCFMSIRKKFSKDAILRCPNFVVLFIISCTHDNDVPEYSAEVYLENNSRIYNWRNNGEYIFPNRHFVKVSFERVIKKPKKLGIIVNILKNKNSSLLLIALLYLRSANLNSCPRIYCVPEKHANSGDTRTSRSLALQAIN